jgi:hypothetical protein
VRFKLLVISFTIFFFSTQGYSQSNTSRSSGGPRSQLSKIFVAGLAGSVLGLSTLSFYGKPQKHLENIAYGFAAGVLVGVIFVTYETTQNPQSLAIDEIPEIQNQRKFIEQESASYQLLSYSMDF